MCPSRWRWYRFTFFSFSLPSSIFRWPEINFSYLTTGWAATAQSFRWPDLSSFVVDNLLWTVVVAFESLALAAMLCYFFVFCGCTL